MPGVGDTVPTEHTRPEPPHCHCWAEVRPQPGPFWRTGLHCSPHEQGDTGRRCIARLGLKEHCPGGRCCIAQLTPLQQRALKRSTVPRKGMLLRRARGRRAAEDELAPGNQDRCRRCLMVAEPVEGRRRVSAPPDPAPDYKLLGGAEGRATDAGQLRKCPRRWPSPRVR